ncbi:MAG: hypothetical protein J5999_00810 [Oscillospiraceae bacterium]|nr:hypothetical protein [Oscillospiraceae bacterium]
MKIKDIFICALSALLLCSCTNTANSGEISETVETEPTTTTETSVTEETTAETTSAQTAEPEIVTEFFYDLDFDGNDEKIELKPKSAIVCYDSEGNKIGAETGQWCDQMDHITLKWYDDGQNIYPALYSKYDVDFAHDEYYVVLSLKDGVFTAERLVKWGFLRSDNGGWHGPPYLYDYYSDVYGDWISEEKCENYKAMVYDKIEDTPSYHRSLLVKDAVRMLKNTSPDTERVIFVDINNDSTDELVLFAERMLYCFRQDGNSVAIVGKADLDEESFVLQWYNNREKVFPVIKCEDSSKESYYKLTLDGDSFKSELFLQNSGGKYFADGKEISEDDFLRKKYFIWDKKQNRLEYTVEAAVEYSTYGMLYDIENDGIPEHIMGYYGAYVDIEEGVMRLDGYSPKSAGGFLMDSNSELKKYYDSVNDEYFYISTRYDGYTTCTSNRQVEKTVFYSNTSDSKTLASEHYYFSSYTSEKSDKIYLEGAYFNGEKIDGDRFVDNTDLKLYHKLLEEYLSSFTLVDTITASQFMSETPNTYEDYKNQALEIERKYLENPSAAKVKELEQVTICGKAVDVNTKHIGIPSDISPEDIEKLALLENLESIYIYDKDENTYFDLELLSGVADRITSISLKNVNDAEKLSMFPNLTSLYVNTNYNEAAELSALSALTGLEYLGINGKITNLDFVKDMTKLKEIRFFAVSDEVDCFKAAAVLPSLKVIVFSGQGMVPSAEQLECFADRDDIIMPQIK